MALSETAKKNFETLARAFANGDACVVEVVDKTTGKTVPMICAAWRSDEDGKDMMNFAPFAVLVGDEEDPYERFAPPEGVETVEVPS